MMTDVYYVYIIAELCVAHVKQRAHGSVGLSQW